MNLFTKKCTAIGIDIGSRMIKAVQLDIADGSQRIRTLSLAPRIHPQEDINQEEVNHLRDMLKRQGFAGREIILSVPDELLLRGVFELPPAASADSRAQMARMELSRIHHIDPDAFEMVYWGLSTQGPSRAGAQTVVVACPHEAADRLLDTFEQHGFHVKALDSRTAAAARACQPLCAAPPAITAILDLGWSSTKLLLVCGETVLYERFLKTEMSRLITQISKEFRIDLRAASQLVDTIGIAEQHMSEAYDTVSADVIHRLIRRHLQTIIEELKIPFSYVNRQYTGEGITCLLLLGGGACIPGMAVYLEDTLGMDVKGAVPHAVVDGAGEELCGQDNPTMTVALGLAKFSDKE